jgi:N6-adenosine-specific RNA methylase IME4
MEYRPHPLADIFPLITGDEFVALKQDIKDNGLLEPIWMLDGMILDGRNRFRACQEVGVSPVFREYEGDEPAAFVISLNLKRRHLDKSQSATVAVVFLPFLEAAAKDRKKKAGENYGKGHSKVNQKIDEPIRETESARAVKAAQSLDIAAQMVGTNRQYVADAKKLKEEKPEVFEQVRKGEKTISQAKREILKESVAARLEEVAANEVIAPTGLFDVIVIDPPWPMQKIDRDVRPNQVEFDYPTMTEDELSSLEIPADEDCHVWLWTTHKFMPMAFRLLNSWGMKYVCTFVWHKPGGFQPIGLPQYNCEFALYARKGTPQFIDTKALPTCFNAPRGAHSEKPEEFYEMVRRVTGGRKLDMFNRRLIEGFAGWGKEAA